MDASQIHQIKLFLMFYLDTHGSPFIQSIEEGEPGSKIKVVDFGSSRNLILMVAWLMQEIDLFSRYDQSKLVHIRE